jgi:hypothetical protein
MFDTRMGDLVRSYRGGDALNAGPRGKVDISPGTESLVKDLMHPDDIAACASIDERPATHPRDNRFAASPGGRPSLVNPPAFSNSEARRAV